MRSLSTGKKPLVKKKNKKSNRELVVSLSLWRRYAVVVGSLGISSCGRRQQCPAIYSIISKNNNVLDGTKLLTQRVERVLPLRSAHASPKE